MTKEMIIKAVEELGEDTAIWYEDNYEENEIHVTFMDGNVDYNEEAVEIFWQMLLKECKEHRVDWGHYFYFEDFKVYTVCEMDDDD